MSRSLRLPFALSRGPTRRDARRIDAALRRPVTYPHPAGRMQRIETHLSVVYLAGRFAYKIVKPVRFGFVDLATLAQRRRCALAGYRLNRAFAAPLYLDVWTLAARGRRCVLVRDARDGALRRGDEPLAYVVRMRRFDAREVLATRLATDGFDDADIDALARRLAHDHTHASRRTPRSGFGSAPHVAAQCRAVLDALDTLGAPHGALADTGLRAWCEAELAGLAPQLQARHALGFVRACHGDLHLGNIVRWRHRVLMFDCIEFDEALRWIDVASDLAFLLMDIAAHDRADCAQRLLADWLDLTGDYGALAVLPLYTVYRALVRVLTAQLRGDAADSARYLRVAMAAAATVREQRARPCLLLCHGVSGSGKSLASSALATRIDAVRLSSDTVRKRLAGRADHERLPATAYTVRAIDEVYDHLLAQAATVLDSGRTTLVDATFLHERHRAKFFALARRLCVPVAILVFHASRAALYARVAQRAAAGRDASDADASVLTAQFAQLEPLSADERACAIVFDPDVEPTAYRSEAFWQPLLDALYAGSMRAADAAAIR